MIRNYFALSAVPVPEAQFHVMRDEVPGVQRDRRTGRLQIPGDALPFARQWMTRNNIDTRVELVPNPHRPNPIPRDRWIVAPEAISGLRSEWAQRFKPKQREALTFAQQTQGSLIQLPAGRGKTLVGVAFSLSYPQTRTLIVTPLPEQWIGAYHQFTTPDVTARVAQVTGKVAFRAVWTEPKGDWTWTPLVSRERLLAEFEAMTVAGRQRMLRLLRAGIADPGMVVPKSLSQFFQRDRVVRSAPHWRILRKSDNACVDILPRDYEGILTTSAELELRAEAADGKHPRKALVARAVLARVDGESWESIAARLCLSVEEVQDLVYPWWANDYCHIRSLSDLGVPPTTEIAVISWGILVDRVPALRDWADTVIFDESQEAKSRRRTVSRVDSTGKRIHEPALNQSWAAWELAKARKSARVMLLSATPDVNSIEDLWAQYDLINPYGWGNFQGSGIRYFGGTPGQFGLIYGNATNVEEFRARSARIHFIATIAQMGRASPMMRTVTSLGLGDLSAANPSQAAWKAAAKRGHSGLVELRLSTLAEQMHGYVLRRVKEVVEAGQRLVIATGRKEHVERLVTDLRKGHPTVPVYGVTGEVPTGDRKRLVAEFRVSQPGIMVVTIDSMGVGIDGLQNTHKVFVLMLPWNHGTLIQLEGRFDRYDSEEILTDLEYFIPRDTIAEDILETVIRKAEASGAALDVVDNTKLAQDLAQEVGVEETPAALEAMAAALLAGDKMRQEALERRASILQQTAVTLTDEDRSEAVLEDEEVYMDPWRESVNDDDGD